MEFSTFLWIGGLVVAYTLGKAITTRKDKKKILSLTAELSKAQAEIEQLKQQRSQGTTRKSLCYRPCPNKFKGQKSPLSLISIFLNLI